MKKILIVEDEVPLRKALVSQLKHEDIQVFEAGDGEEGLKTALKEKPDLMLLDIVMPKKDGMTMLKELRADKWGKTADVILLTNLGGHNKVAEAMETGTYEYLVKADWSILDVIDKIKAKLGVD